MISTLRAALGAEASFRAGQAEAIASVLAGGRLLLVERTGWGKSVVYFTATRLLRDAGGGSTIVISPLLSLMRDQRRSAARFGLRTAHVDSGADFAAIGDELGADAVDVVFTTPEQLTRDRFGAQILGSMRQPPALLVIDEAHCISDWGHDFRPEYRRLARFLERLAIRPPLLATTATANDRVVADVVEQLGADLVVQRGALTRESLRLQAIELHSQAARLAWLASNLPAMDGSGIVYCLTIADCKRVAEWLQSRGLAVAAYHAELDDAARIALEQALLANEVKALVATVALGMGFDKPDLGFVVHYQLPGSIVAYYQQVGRAGRALPTANAVLLAGHEDAEIHDYFIRTAFPDSDDVDAVLLALDEEAPDPLTLDGVLARVNIRRGKAQEVLALFDIEGIVRREGARYTRTDRAWSADRERIARVTERRRTEFEQVRALPHQTTCLMRSIVEALDDPDPADCGVCAVCAAPAFPTSVEPALEQAALVFLRRANVPVAPRKQVPATIANGRKAIPVPLQCHEGRALASWRDGAYGDLVAAGRFGLRPYPDELVSALAALAVGWSPVPAPAWVAAVPSAGAFDRVSALAEALAELLDLPFHAVIARADVPPQRSFHNTAGRHANASAAYSLIGSVPPAPVRLVDDVVDTGWTLAVCGEKLRTAGAGAVHPLVLARWVGRD